MKADIGRETRRRSSVGPTPEMAAGAKVVTAAQSNRE
jgi:hypothetical protein